MWALPSTRPATSGRRAGRSAILACRRIRSTNLLPNVPMGTPMIPDVTQLQHARAGHLPIIRAGGTRSTIAGLLLGRTARRQAAVVLSVAHAFLLVDARAPI